MIAAVVQEINWTTIIVAMFAALPAAIASFVAMKKADVIIEKADKTEQKADVIIEKAVEIHSLTNSQLSTVTKALEVANEKINGMEKLMATFIAQKQEKEIEQAKATATTATK